MTLKNWVLAEMDRRKMSQHEFAKLIGINQSSLSRFLSEKEDKSPTSELLLALARGTNTSLLELVRLAFPEVVEETELPPDAKILAQRIMELPDDLRLAVEAIIQRG